MMSASISNSIDNSLYRGSASLVVDECLKFCSEFVRGPEESYFIVVGSFARATHTLSSDIDIFFLVDSYEFKVKIDNKFRDFYFYLHRKLCHPPDIEYPGELLSVNEFNCAIDNAVNSTLIDASPINEIHDALVWSAMILGPQICVLDTFSDLASLRKKSLYLLELWRPIVAFEVPMRIFIRNINYYCKNIGEDCGSN